jgi:outer membrane protein assembly factor BamE (lipoprotein component of BamABCDE complex)
MKTREIAMITLFGLALLTGCEKTNESTPATGSQSGQTMTETAPAATAPAPAVTEGNE